MEYNPKIAGILMTGVILVLSGIALYPTDYLDMLGDEDFVVIEKGRSFELIAKDYSGQCDYLRWHIDVSHYKIYCGWSMKGDFYIRRTPTSNVTFHFIENYGEYAIVRRLSKHQDEYFTVGVSSGSKRPIAGWDIWTRYGSSIYAKKGYWNETIENKKCDNYYGEFKCYEKFDSVYDGNLFIDYKDLGKQLDDYKVSLSYGNRLRVYEHGKIVISPINETLHKYYTEVSQ